MKAAIRAFVLLEKAGLLTDSEKAARVLGIYEVVSCNTQNQLWAIAHDPDPAAVGGTSMNGSEPVVEMPTEKNPEFKAGPPPNPVRLKRGPKVPPGRPGSAGA